MFILCCHPLARIYDGSSLTCWGFWDSGTPGEKGGGVQSLLRVPPQGGRGGYQSVTGQEIPSTPPPCSQPLGPSWFFTAARFAICVPFELLNAGLACTLNMALHGTSAHVEELPPPPTPAPAPSLALRYEGSTAVVDLVEFGRDLCKGRPDVNLSFQGARRIVHLDALVWTMPSAMPSDTAHPTIPVYTSRSPCKKTTSPWNPMRHQCVCNF